MENEGRRMKKGSMTFEINFEEWVSSGQLEVCQMGNSRRDQDSNSNMNLIL